MSFLFPNKILVLLNNMTPGFNYINNSLLEQFQRWTCKIFQNADVLISPTPLPPVRSCLHLADLPPPPPLDVDILYGWPLKNPTLNKITKKEHLHQDFIVKMVNDFLLLIIFAKKLHHRCMTVNKFVSDFSKCIFVKKIRDSSSNSRLS